MQSVQRRFGKLLPRTADEAQVGVLLKDFDDADKMLAKVSLPNLDVDMQEDTLLNRSSSLTPRRLGGTRGEISWSLSNDSLTASKSCASLSSEPTIHTSQTSTP